MSRYLPSLVPAFGWGAMYAIADPALARVDAFHLTAIRYVLASLLFLAVLRAVEGARALRLDGRGTELFLLGTAGIAGFNLFAFAGLEHTSPQHVALIVATSPLMALLADAALARRAPRPLTLAFTLLAFAGVLIVIGGGDPLALFNGGVNAGDLLVFIGTACFVVYTFGARRFRGYTSLRYTALSAAGGTITILAVTEAVTLLGMLDTPSLGDVGAIWWPLAYLVLVGALAAVLAWNEGVKRLGAPNAALFMNLVPVVAFAIAIAEGYHAEPIELAGAALTIAALVGANLSARGRAPAPRAHPHPDGAPARAARSG